MTNLGPGMKIIRETGGSEIAEAALVLPLAFMVLLGIYWFGLAFNTYATINSAAREGARIAVTQTCATCGNAAPAASTVASTVTQTMQASRVATAVCGTGNCISKYSPSLNFCGSGTTSTNCDSSNNNITVCTGVKLSPAASPGPPVCGVSVSFQYPYQFWLPFTSLNNQQIILTADVQMQGEY